MLNSNDAYKLDSLTSEYYMPWSRCIEIILDDLELWDIATGMEMEPIPIDTNKVKPKERQAIVDWEKKDKKAHKEIYLCISDEYLVYVNKSMTATEMWTRLQGIFESRAAVGIVNLQCDYLQTIAEEGTNIEEHIWTLQELQQQLNARGHLITNADFTNMCLTSLSESWSTFITAVNATGLTLTSETLVAWILDEDWAKHARMAQQTMLKA